MSSIWRPFTQMQKVRDPLPEVVKARKASLFLKKEGALGRKGSGFKGHLEVIDAISSWWLITHGHCEPSIVRAVQKEAERMDQILFANFTHEKAEQLVQELSSLLPKKFQKFFFSDNGSTSVEVALKMAVQSFSQQGRPERREFLSFKNSYHGDTAGAMSVSARGIFTKAYESFLFPVHQCEQGVLSSDSEEKFYRDFERKIEKHHKRLAGVIIEPLIQGAGGMIVWKARVLERICRIAREAGVLLIFDEIMTGFGRTGTVFAFEQIKTKPDILCLSKGLTGGFLPLALTVTTSSIYKSFLSSKKEKALLHGHSFTGNPLSCSAALANVRLLKKKKTSLLKKWKKIEEINKERLEVFKNHPGVLDTRFQGTMAVVQKIGDSSYQSSFAEEATARALKQGVFLRPLGGSVYLLPPYCITEKQLHKTWDVIESLF